MVMGRRCFSSMVLGCSANTMDCGSGVPLCGVLTVQSGYGEGNYKHAKPGVHGLWPETGDYGTSQCLAPSDLTDPTTVFSCYDQPEGSESDQLSFEEHEWEKHGVCAGTVDSTDFFTQICSLATDPVKVLSDTRASEPGNFDVMASALTSAGYAVFNTDTVTKEIQLSACSGPGSGNHWKLAAVADFQSTCGGSGPSPSPGPSPTPGGECVSGQHGPKCSSNSDCDGVKDCVRCAKSGYCTDVPLELQAHSRFLAEMV